MKYYILLLVILSQPLLSQKWIVWKKPGQVEIITAKEYIDYDWNQLHNYNHEVKVINVIRDSIYIKLFSLDTTLKFRKIDLTRSITIPTDGKAPVPGKSSIKNATRLIRFDYIEQKIKVFTGETVNVEYGSTVQPDKVYIAYESTSDGYILELSTYFQEKIVRFTALCDLHIVADPSNTKLEIPDELRYEQVIWTPREDKSWEVRIGTTERGCTSYALEKIMPLRTKEYNDKIEILKKEKK